MPLTKTKPSSLLHSDNPIIAGRETLRERRRTLQSIRELSSQNGSLAEWRAPSFENHIAYQNSNTANANVPIKQPEEIRLRQIRRKSLPSQSYQQEYQPKLQPSAHLIPDETPVLYRSNTDPTGGKQVRFQDLAKDPRTSTGGHSRHRSLNSSLRSRHVQGAPLSTVTEGQQIQAQRTPSSGFNNKNHQLKSAKQPPSSAQANMRPTEGWNAQRERERIKREQEIITTRLLQARERERNANRIEGGSVIVPTSSPSPIIRANTVYAKRHIGCPQPSPQKVSHRPMDSPHHDQDVEVRQGQVHRHENHGAAWQSPSMKHHAHQILRHDRAGSGLSHHSNVSGNTVRSQPSRSLIPRKPLGSRPSSDQVQSLESFPSKGRLEVFPALTNITCDTPHVPGSTSHQQPPPPPQQVPRRYSTPVLRTRLRSQSQPQPQQMARTPSLIKRENSDSATLYQQQQQKLQIKVCGPPIPAGLDRLEKWHVAMAQKESEKQPVHATHMEEAPKVSEMQPRETGVIKEIVLEKETSTSTSTSTSTWSSSSSSTPSGKKRWGRRSLTLTRGFVCRVFGVRAKSEGKAER